MFKNNISVINFKYVHICPISSHRSLTLAWMFTITSNSLESNNNGDNNKPKINMVNVEEEVVRHYICYIAI